MYVLYIIQRFFFTLTKSAKTHGQKLEHWQNYNNSNGKLALKHIVPFPTENDNCRIPSPCSRTVTIPSRHDWKNVDWDVKPQHKQKQWLWFSTCFPLVDFPTGKKYIGKNIILSHFTIHLVWSTQRISKIPSAYTKTYSFYRAIRILTPEWGNRIFFSISMCFGVGAREIRLSDNMTLGWKTERSARTSTKMLSTKQAIKYRLVCKLSDQISTNVIKPLKC